MSPAKITDNKDLDRGKRLSEERKKIWKSRAAFREETNLSDGSLRNWENGLNITCECLRAIHERGGDIIYILTGKRSQSSNNANILTNNDVVNAHDITQSAGYLHQATGTDGQFFPASERNLLLEQIAELKRDKAELRADKALLVEQLEASRNQTDEIRLLYEELARVKSASESVVAHNRTRTASNNKASS